MLEKWSGPPGSTLGSKSAFRDGFLLQKADFDPSVESGRSDHFASMRCGVIPDYLAILHHKSEALEFCNIVGVSIRRALLVEAMGWADPLRGVSEGFQPDWGRFCQTSRMDGMILLRILSRRLRVRGPEAYRHGSQNDGRTLRLPHRQAL